MDKATHRCKHICKPLQADTQTKVCKRASTSPTREKLFFKISFPSKIFKTATAQPTHKDQKTSLTMTAKPTTDRNRVGKGESHPQTSHRTVLEPLDSHGSS